MKKLDKAIGSHYCSTNNVQIFFLSLSLFAFWTLLSPVISTVFAGKHLQILFPIPMISLGIGILISGVLSNLKKLKLLHETIQLLTTLSIPISLSLISFFQKKMDIQTTNNIPISGKLFLENIVHNNTLSIQILVFSAIGLPFLFYGIFLSFSFLNLKNEKLISFYSAELLGICVGSGVVISFITMTSYGFIFSVICITGFMSTLGNKNVIIRIVSPVILLLPILYYLNPVSFEPQRNLSFVTRDFRMEQKTNEISRGWTPYAKVQTLSQTNKKGIERRLIALGDGTGIARLYSVRDGNVFTERSGPDLIATTLKPKTALVLFAGGGRDLYNIHYNLTPPPEITGIEVNPLVVKQALEVKPSPLKSLISQNKVNMKISEGRNYLSQDDKKYDLILYSWSGATTAHFSGAILHTTQYLFTTNAIEIAYNKLNKGGHLAIFGASKTNLMLSFIDIMQKRGIPPKQALNSILLTGQKNSVNESLYWGWDDFNLIIKNGEFQKEEILKMSEDISLFSYDIKISKLGPSVDFFKPFYKMFFLEDYEQAKLYINGTTNFRSNFYSHDDNNPFIYNVLPTKRVLTFNYLTKCFKKILKGQLEGEITTFIVLILILSIFVFLVMLFLNKNWIGTSRGVFSSVYCYLLGFTSTGFVLILTYKALLFFGNPTKAIVLSQITASLGSFLGALLYLYTNGLKKVSLLMPLLLAIFSIITLQLVITNSLDAWLYLPYIGPLLFSLIVLPIVVFISLVFSFEMNNLSNSKTNSVHFIFSINLLGSGLAGLLIPFAVEQEGILSTLNFLTYASLIILFQTLLLHSKVIKTNPFIDFNPR